MSTPGFKSKVAVLMQALRCIGISRISMAAIALMFGPAATVGITNAAADSDTVTTVPLKADLRGCDFSPVAFAPAPAGVDLATGSALVHRSGSRVVAEVHLAAPPEPGTHFDVGLIQVPRPSSATCGPGDPGTAFTGLDTDAAGIANVTVRDTLRQGTTGVWVIVERPSGHSQNPTEFYTSDFVAPM